VQLRALERPDVLDVILQYAGPEQWLFLGGVSKAWAAMHHGGSEMLSNSQPEPAQSLRRKVTSYRAAAASLRRALYACDYDPSLKATWRG
jgi:hypothetical protein